MPMLTVLNDTVRSRIRAEMGWQGINQKELAKRTGFSPEYISRRINGTVPLTIQDTEIIGGALGVTLIVARPVSGSAAR
jgi:transcriptional regulator with XRE-family HTH domain